MTVPNNSGHVVPGGDPLTFQVGDVLVRKLSVGTMDNNVYLIESDDDAVLIDAAADAMRIMKFFGAAKISTLITTHRHFDHLGATAEVVKLTGAEPVCGKPDREAIREATGVECRGVWTSEVITCGKYHLGVLGLVGHTPGSIAIILDVANNPIHIFTGDSLFPGGIGKTNTPEDFQSLFHDVKSKIFAVFLDDTVIHPGHGDDTTIGRERPFLDEWEQRGW